MEKILIVDDSPLQAAQLKSILDNEYDVTVAQAAEDGLCRAIFLTDVHANAAGYERIAVQMLEQ